jgi:hypothetical protein
MTVADWWDQDRLAALPPYLVEQPHRGRPVVQRPEPAVVVTPRIPPSVESAWVWLAGARPDRTSMSTVATISRRVDLSPPDALWAVRCWWRDHQSSPWLEAGRDRLELADPDTTPMPGCLCRLFGRLHLHLVWPNMRVELDLSAWSTTESQIELRPARIPRSAFRERRFFDAAHAMLEALVAEVTMPVQPAGA